MRHSFGKLPSLTEPSGSAFYEGHRRNRLHALLSDRQLNHHTPITYSRCRSQMCRNGFSHSPHRLSPSAHSRIGGPKRTYFEFVLIVAQPAFLIVVLVLVYPLFSGR